MDISNDLKAFLDVNECYQTPEERAMLTWLYTYCILINYEGRNEKAIKEAGLSSIKKEKPS